MILSSNDSDVAQNLNEKEDDCDDIFDDDEVDNCSLYFSAHASFHTFLFL